ncbi:MAG: hypothetical protein Q8P38_08070 [Candidatus Nanopelagicales bacterium]|nr:hypothetical protein [Candidatus Nanopelagicales bacterium]
MRSVFRSERLGSRTEIRTSAESAPGEDDTSPKRNDVRRWARLLGAEFSERREPQLEAGPPEAGRWLFLKDFAEVNQLG